MGYLKERRDGYIIYKIEGELCISEIELIEKLSSDIREEGKKGKINFIWDLSSLKFLDSSGLSVIALTAAYCLRSSSFLRICGAKKETERLLGLGNLSLHFKLYDTVNEAIGECELSASAVLEHQL
jgi:anti-anti-sigma factor